MRPKQRIPQVKLYIRRNSRPGQPYELVDLRDIKFQEDGDVYCIHFYGHDGKRKWKTVGTDFKAAWAAVQDKQRELLSDAPATPATPKPSPDAPLTLEQQRDAFLTDRMELGKEPHVLIRVKNGFRTKTGKSRRVELERGLADRLAAWKQSHPGSTYVFADDDGKIEGHFLRHCKDIAHRAGLNCGKCRPCVEKNECEHFYLHKFRDTFCSWAAWDNLDPVTVQKQAGHASLDMTMRYFARKRNQQIHADMNRVFGTPVAVSATA